MLDNPLPKLLKQIPTEVTLLDYTLLDDMRAIIKEVTHLIVNNAYVLALLLHLEGQGIVSMYNISSVKDKCIYLIRKNT